jgi:molybdate transport system regulatory protein
MDLAPFKSALAIPPGRIKIKYLSIQEVDALTYTFQSWFDQSPSTGKKRKIRGRYWLVYLVLRFTGARLGEVIQINDSVDIDFRSSDIRIVTLKRRNEKPKRIIPVPSQVISEIATFLADFPDMRGKAFSVDANNFRKVFYAMAKEAKLLKEEGVRLNGTHELFPHPHTLRHTRAIELLKAGLPVPAVQDLLGHSSMLTTAQYVRLSGQDVKHLMRQMNLL